MVQLEELFERLLPQLPTEPEQTFKFSAGNCGCPPDEIATAKLKLRARQHAYSDGSPCDLIDFFADKPTYQRLGILLLASTFQPNRPITLHLTHPETAIRNLKIECYAGDPEQLVSGLAQLPVAYGYYATPLGHIHPLWHDESRVENYDPRGGGRASYSLPFLGLSDVRDESGGLMRLADGFGDPEATVTMASLLLDLGMPQTELTEIYLESPAGNWSVAIGSAEMRLWVGYEYN